MEFQPLRLTFEELAALGALLGRPDVLFGSEAPVPVRESGQRSLIARGLVRPAVDNVEVAEAVIQLFGVLAEPEIVLIAARSDRGSGTSAARLLTANGEWLVEEPAFPGVFGYARIDGARVLEFLMGAFGLNERHGFTRGETSAASIVIPVLADTGSGVPQFPADWENPTVNTVVISSAESDRLHSLSWITSGERHFLIEDTERADAWATQEVADVDICSAIRDLVPAWPTGGGGK